ncbi:Decarboxylase [Acidipropionibacterium acidipropionici ATCC 4875]|uniref:Decarboxylase n=1 Tax=Acidipropionibacterium acidipropionici (strain ATCC 4875 / DSM 20272 / JCM 6432 / NBRC 12425 / NCIMB 8070 / 4) TaxID=1171373 RepID=K7RS98_ACIA4|nr:decarboxylase [Acidipropionibacterium acidipropionici]AFV90894.1 Decarboxylase [Acidipropionibacterium acidipropionici ATCC 4875]
MQITTEADAAPVDSGQVAPGLPDAATPDAGAPDLGTARIGIIYPGIGAEEDYPLAQSLVDDLEVDFLNTDAGDVAHTVEDLLAVGTPADLAGHARALVTQFPQAQSVMWACTSGSFVYGLEGTRGQAAAITTATGLPASSTSLSFVAALEFLGVRRVAVAASYPSQVAERFRALLEDAGVTVTSFQAHGIPSAGGAGELSVAQLITIARQADTADADAVLIPDTAIHGIAGLPALEVALGKPVLTANQVSIWQAMRLAGREHPRGTGMGALFT